MSRVLIVHRDPATGARLAAAVMEAGLDAVVVTSGERAMDRFIQEPADVLLIDYDLEGRDGITAAEAIRWMPGGRRARLILTAFADPEEGALASLAERLDTFATEVGTIQPRRLAELAVRAASVRPHEAETRVLSAEEANEEARKMRAAVSDSWRDATHEQPSRAVALPAPSVHSVLDGTLEDASRERWELPDADGRAEGEEVRRVVSATPRGSVEMFGSFSDTGFSRVLSQLADQRATGALICIHPPDERATTSGTEPTKIVYFRAGVPAHVRSNVVRECLGQVLQRQRKIGPATLKESVDAVRRGEGRQGEVLVRMGAISAVELSEALAEQLRVKLFDLFFWELGTYRFAPDRPPPTELIDLEMGLAEIAFRGVRLAVPLKRALALLAPHRDDYVVPRARKLVRFVRLEIFSAGLEAVIRMADGSRTLGEILDASAVPGEAAQLLHAMECLDAVCFEDRPLRARREPSRVAPLPPRPREPSAAATDQAAELDAGSSAAPPDELATLDEPADDTPASAVALGVPDEVPEWEEVTANEEIAANLGDLAPERGDPSSHDDAAGEASADEGPAPGGPADRGSAIGAGVDAREDSPPEDSAPKDCPPEDSAPKDSAPKDSAPEDSAPKDSAPKDSAPEDSAPKDSAPKDDASSDEEHEEAHPDEAEGDPRGSGMRQKPESPEELDRRVKAQLKAERVFRRGIRALDKGEAAAALECFESALALCPDESRFALHVVYAEHAVAPEDEAIADRALERVESACEEDSAQAWAHLLRARLLTEAGREQEAERAYVRVLELEPAHRAAKIELKALRAR